MVFTLDFFFFIKGRVELVLLEGVLKSMCFFLCSSCGTNAIKWIKVEERV